MAEMTPQVCEVLEKALALSTQDRGLVIDRLIASLDEGPAEDAPAPATCNPPCPALGLRLFSPR